MKRSLRMLSLMLSLALCLGPLATSLAEGEPEAALPVEEPAPAPEPAAGEPPADDGPADGAEIDAPAEPGAEDAADPGEAPIEGDASSPEAEPQEPAATDAPETEGGTQGGETPAQPGEAEDVPAIDYAQSAAASPAFAQGYAELLGACAAYDGPDAGANALWLLRSGAVYALERRASGAADRLLCAFDAGGERTAWIDAAQLRPLSPQEALALIERCGAREGAHFLRGDPALPLDAPDCEPAAPATPEPSQEPPQAPAMLVPRTDFTLGAGEGCEIGVRFEDGLEHAVSYRSDDSKIARVTDKGRITGVKPGETAVTLTSEFGHELRLSVSVKAAPGRVSLSAPAATLGVNEQIALTAALPKDTASALAFSSSNPAVASVDAGGRVITFAPGAATVTVKTFNGKKASVKLTVKPAPEGITLSAHELRIAAQDGATLAAKLSSGSAGAYSFRVEPEGSDVLAVDAGTGRIHALNPGTATVIVETYNHVTDRCEVTVTPAPARIELSQIEATLGVGETLALPGVALFDAEGNSCAGSYSFSTEDKKLATVDAAKGTIKAVKKTAAVKIIATAYNGVEAELVLHIVDAPSRVTLSASRTILGVGEGLPLMAKLNSTSVASKLTFTSSAPAVLAVDGAGNVSALGIGTSTVTVKTFNGKKASVKFTVKPAPESVELSAHELRIAAQDGATFTAKLNSGSAGAYSFRVEPEGSDVLAVDASTGRINALNPGTAIVIVETYNHITDRCEVTVTPAPVRIELAQVEATLGVGETLALPGVALFDAEGNPCAGSYSFSTEDKKLATVDAAKGTIKAVKKTAAVKIIATAYNGVEAELVLHIVDAPSRVALSASRTILGVGEALPLTAKLNSTSVASKLTFTSSAPAVLAVDGAGNVSALGVGTSTVTVKTFNGKKASVKFTVKPAPESVELSAHELRIAAQDGATLAAKLSSGSAGAYSFRVEPEGSDVLAVDASTGKISALQPGTATVIVETYNHITDRCEVTVTPAPARIELAQVEATLGVGETLALPGVALFDAEGNPCAGSYSFTTADKKYATVNAAKGTVKAVKKTAAVRIIATTYNGLEAELALRIVDAPSKVALSAQHAALGVGEELELAAKLSPASAASALSFTSSSEAVLRVDGRGRVTAVAPGAATVTVQTFNGKKSTLKLTVLPAPEAVALPEALTMGLGEAYVLAPQLTPAGSGGGIRFWSDDPAVAAVDETSGRVTALAYGETTVRAQMYNGASAACALRVRNAPEGIAFRDAGFTLGVGDARQLLPPELLGADVASAQIRYKSSNARVATVSGDGLVTALRTGSAKLTVSCYNRDSQTITVTVKAATKSISFAEAQRRLFIDREFTPEVRFASGVPGSYSLTSSDPAVAQVGPDGHSVRGVSAGTARITATSYNGKVTAEPLTVTVPALPERVWFDLDEVLLGEGDGTTLHACMGEGQGAEMAYWIDDPGVANLEILDNETVRVTALSYGATALHMRAQNGAEAQVAVEARRAPTMLTLTPSRAQRCIDEGALQLRVGYGGEGEGGSVRFESSDEAIATVSASGLVRFLATGEVRITARSYNGHVAACALTIGERPARMYFEQAEYLVALGDRVRIPASFEGGCESYALTAGDAAIAQAAGEEVLGLALGETTLRAVSRSGLEAECALRVVEAPTSIALDAERIELTIGTGSTHALRAAALPGGAGTVRFYTTDPSVATVDSATGEVRAAGGGDCAIRAVSYNGCEAECQVHVGFLLEGVKVGIDPGHQAKGNPSTESSSPRGGGYKAKVSWGTSGKATRTPEHVTNLTVGLLLRDELLRLGAEVYMTRETADINISNQQRAKLMNDNGVDIAVRLHCNAASSTSVEGMHVYIRRTCAYRTGEVDDPADLLARERAAANAVCAQFHAATGCKSADVITSDAYTMNNWAKMPCLLVEMGYMSNYAEDRRLNDPAYQAQMVRGMINGICEYMGRDLPTEWE